MNDEIETIDNTKEKYWYGSDISEDNIIYNGTIYGRTTRSNETNLISISLYLYYRCWLSYTPQSIMVT